MMRDRQELSIIHGGRPPAPDANRRQASVSGGLRQPIRGMKTAPRKPGTALSDSLTSMEQRLSALLEDRERIGRDLHDSVLQSLYAIGLNLEASRKISPPMPPDADRARAHAVEQLNRLIHEIRGTIRRLQDGTIQSFDLSEELANLQHVYEQAGGICITLDMQQNALDLLTLEEEQEILHIVREALSNSVRHARATHITIALKSRGSRIRLVITDDGIGFDQTARPRRGYGLTNMDARARKLGGILRIHSTPQGGTKLTVELFLAPLLAPV